MAGITRVGLAGPLAAYLGFVAKATVALIDPTADVTIQVRADVTTIQVRPEATTIYVRPDSTTVEIP